MISPAVARQHVLRAVRGAAQAAPAPLLAALAQSVGSSAPASGFHTSSAAARGSKNLDWYIKAVRRIEREKTRVDPPAFPVETLHGRKRARAFLDLQFGKDAADAPAPVQRVVVELADDIVPITVQNFLTLCQRAVGEGYPGSEVYKVQKGHAIFLGDWVSGDGRGGHSALGARFFPDENFVGRHTQPGVLAMASAGVHSNASVFYVTLAKADHLDGRNVVFGRVLTGMDVISKVGGAFCVNLKPATPISIKSAGPIAEGSPEWAAVDKALAQADKDRAAKEKAAAAKDKPAAAPGKEDKKKDAAPAGGKKEKEKVPAKEKVVAAA